MGGRSAGLFPTSSIPVTILHGDCLPLPPCLVCLEVHTVQGGRLLSLQMLMCSGFQANLALVLHHGSSGQHQVSVPLLQREVPLCQSLIIQSGLLQARKGEVPQPYFMGSGELTEAAI